MDFLAGFGFAAGFRGAGLTAPATSVRSMISRSLRKAPAGCSVGISGFGAVDRHLDVSRKIARRRGIEREVLFAADACDRFHELLGIGGGVFLVEVAGLQQMFGEQFLDMGRAIERGGQLPELGADRRHEDVGEAAAFVLGGAGRGDFGGERFLMQPFDDGAEQRFLGFEMMVERLPRQARGLCRLLDRRAPKTLPAEHQHRGIENAGTRAHLTILTKLRRNVK